MLYSALAIVVLAHGVGHVLFLAPTIRLANWAGQTGHSWLLTPTGGESVTQVVGGIIWVVTMILFVAGVIGFLTGHDWWRAAIVAGAVVSIVGIVVMWDGIATTNAVFALVFDVLILGSILWAHWPSPELAGS
jgi:hypothetical protein